MDTTIQFIKFILRVVKLIPATLSFALRPLFRMSAISLSFSLVIAALGGTSLAIYLSIGVAGCIPPEYISIAPCFSRIMAFMTDLFSSDRDSTPLTEDFIDVSEHRSTSVIVRGEGPNMFLEFENYSYFRPRRIRIPVSSSDAVTLGTGVAGHIKPGEPLLNIPGMIRVANFYDAMAAFFEHATPRVVGCSFDPCVVVDHDYHFGRRMPRDGGICGSRWCALSNKWAVYSHWLRQESLFYEHSMLTYQRSSTFRIIAEKRESIRCEEINAWLVEHRRRYYAHMLPYVPHCFTLRQLK